MTTTINNEHKKLNVPNLRFPEFQGEWKRTIFKNVITLQRGSSPRPIIEYVTTSDDGVNWIKIGDMPHFGRIVTSTEEKITKEGAKKSRQVNKGDLILSNSMSYGLPYIMGIDGYIHDGWFVLKNFENTFDKDYLCNLLISRAIQNQYKRLAAGGVVQNISSDLVNSVSVSIPTMMEQKKISSLLNLIDERIATQNKIIEDLKKLKCAIIEKLYTKIQGKEYSYGQLFDVVNERNKQMEYSNILSASQEKGMVNRDDLNLDIQFERSNINTYKIVRAGDYVIHLRSFQGGFAFSDKLGVCSPAYTILRPNSLLEYGYLSYYFTSQRFIKSLIIVTYGIRDGRSINVEEWLNMKVVIPSKEHQLHTMNILKSIDGKIVNEETYATCLSNQKQYLLSQMFI